MKEIIKVEIKENDSTRQLKSGDKMYFSPTTSTALFNQIGVISDMKDGFCTMDSQLFYEKVPYHVIGQGTELNIYKKWKREELISTGNVVSRYFEQIKKDDWKIEKELTEDNSKTVTTNILFSDKEKKFLELGLKPLSMEDKWFLYFGEDILHGIRSWTGQEVFQCYFKVHDNQWTIDKLIVSDDWIEPIQAKKNTVESLIKSQLLTKEKLGME
jgi:hypothetical protein